MGPWPQHVFRETGTEHVEVTTLSPDVLSTAVMESCSAGVLYWSRTGEVLVPWVQVALLA